MGWAMTGCLRARDKCGFFGDLPYADYFDPAKQYPVNHLRIAAHLRRRAFIKPHTFGGTVNAAYCGGRFAYSWDWDDMNYDPGLGYRKRLIKTTGINPIIAIGYQHYLDGIKVRQGCCLWIARLSAASKRRTKKRQ